MYEYKCFVDGAELRLDAPAPPPSAPSAVFKIVVHDYRIDKESSSEVRVDGGEKYWGAGTTLRLLYQSRPISPPLPSLHLSISSQLSSPLTAPHHLSSQNRKTRYHLEATLNGTKASSVWASFSEISNVVNIVKVSLDPPYYCIVLRCTSSIPPPLTPLPPVKLQGLSSFFLLPLLPLPLLRSACRPIQQGVPR